MDALTGAMATMREMAMGGAKSANLRKDVLNVTIRDTVIDTCVAFDTNKWETGIAQHGESWIIVEQYDNRAKAQTGHKKWVRTITKTPDAELKDINLWNL